MRANGIAADKKVGTDTVGHFCSHNTMIYMKRHNRYFIVFEYNSPLQIASISPLQFDKKEIQMLSCAPNFMTRFEYFFHQVYSTIVFDGMLLTLKKVEMLRKLLFFAYFCNIIEYQTRFQPPIVAWLGMQIFMRAITPWVLI